MHIQRVPALRGFWDLNKTVLHEICVSGTVRGSLLMQKSPTCTYYISQNPWYLVETVLVILVSGGPPVLAISQPIYQNNYIT